MSGFLYPLAKVTKMCEENIHYDPRTILLDSPRHISVRKATGNGLSESKEATRMRLNFP